MMGEPQIRQVRVWSRRLRISHWLLTAAVLVAIATGWVIGNSADLYQLALDYHYIAGYALLFGLGLRGYLLLFGRDAERWQALLPGREGRRAAVATLRHYASLGRSPLPRWYAHNPLWGPLYLLLLLLLTLLLLTGLGQQTVATVAGISTAELHRGLATVVALLTLAHVVAVIVHELGGSGDDISAMVHGRRSFLIEPLSPRMPDIEALPTSGDGRDRDRAAEGD